MTGAARIDHYDWIGGREAMLRFGPDGGPTVVCALPLFEEANRTRSVAVAMLRALAVRGVGGVLPDLPGTGESLVQTVDARLFAMRDAYEALVETLDAPVYAIGIRSGALLDSFALAAGRWHLTPIDGATVLRDLWRIRHGRRPFDLPALIGVEGPVELAGNIVSPAMLTDLSGAEPYDQPGVPRRVVRLESDPRPADAKLPGAPPWRRAEPSGDAALAERLAADVAAWIAACEG